jgi:hypothetical protein
VVAVVVVAGVVVLTVVVVALLVDVVLVVVTGGSVGNVGLRMTILLSVETPPVSTVSTGEMTSSQRLRRKTGSLKLGTLVSRKGAKSDTWSLVWAARSGIRGQSSQLLGYGCL